MNENIERCLIAENEIKRRIDVLANEILEEMKEKEFMVIFLLKGALVFAADLCRRLPVALEIESLNVSSYKGGMESSGVIEFLDTRFPDVKGRSVLLIDDILDTGRTLHTVSNKLNEMGVSQLRRCVLLSKDKKRDVDVGVEHVAFTIGDEFVVGYGLDYKGKYRNLPYVGILKKDSI